LITVPSNEPIRRAFQDGLTKRNVDWLGGIEVSSVEMVQTYVASAYGFGVTVHAAKLKLHPKVKALPLEGFEELTFGMLWQGRRTSVLDCMFKIVERTALALVQP
jgi:DNA-binding transcriptional LysR family regulator